MTPETTPKRLQHSDRPAMGQRRAQPDQSHQDINQLASAVRKLADTLEPVVEHVPALVEIAQAWNAGKSTGRAMGRVGMITAAVSKWISAVGMAIAVIWFILHSQWSEIIKGFHL